MRHPEHRLKPYVRRPFLSLCPCAPLFFPQHKFQTVVTVTSRSKNLFYRFFSILAYCEWISRFKQSMWKDCKLTTQQAFPRSAIFTLSLSAFLGSRGLRRKFPAVDFPTGNMYNSWLKLHGQRHHLSSKSYHPLPTQEGFCLQIRTFPSPKPRYKNQQSALWKTKLPPLRPDQYYKAEGQESICNSDCFPALFAQT